MGGGSGQRVNAGQPVQMANVLLQNRGKAPAMIERVRILGISGPMQVLGVLGRRVSEQRKPYIGGAAGFPSTDYPAEPLSEDNTVPVINADRTNGLLIVVGLRMPVDGASGSRSVEVTYRIGKRRYQEEFPTSMRICAPESAYQYCPRLDKKSAGLRAAEWPPA